MRRVFAYFSQPGGFIFLIAVIVLVGGALLWRSMRAAPEPAPLPVPPPGAVETGKDATIARALLDMANLAFEESLEEPLEDGVKHVDFALAQAMARTGIAADAAVIEKTELRGNALGSYHYQKIGVFAGGDLLPFLTNLQDSLKAWAPEAELAVSGSGGNPVWTISVMGVVTHEIALLHKKHDVRAGETGRSRREGPGRVLRRRLSGEPARLVIVIDDIGEDMRVVRTLMNLPYIVTCAVWPRSSYARKAAETVHAAGREVLIHQPAEPMKYPETQPGSGALFVSLPDAEIEALVKDSLKRVPYAVGMNNHMGSRFTRDPRAVAAMVRPLKDTGFFVLDSITHPGSVLYAVAGSYGIPSLKRDIFLDAVQPKENVLRQLRKAEEIALVTGCAIAIGHPLPETLAALKEWDAIRDRRVQIVTLSDLVKSP